MTDGLIAFVNARLAEYEQLARSVAVRRYMR